MRAFRRMPAPTVLLTLGLVAAPHSGALSTPSAQTAPDAARAAATAAAPAPAPGLFTELRWRHIGPFRGGRTKAAVGVASTRCGRH